MWSLEQQGELRRENCELWTMKLSAVRTYAAELMLSVGTPSTDFGGVVAYRCSFILPFENFTPPFLSNRVYVAV